MTDEPPFSIERAAPADAPALHAMILALAEYERLSHLCVGSVEDLRAALFADPAAAEVLIGRAAGQPAGFALFFPTFSTFLARRGLWLEDLYVYPQYRGRGLGKALLKAVAGIAHDRRCGRFEWTVLDWNEPAIGFYVALGATVMPDWRIARVAGDGLAQLAGNRPA